MKKLKKWIYKPRIILFTICALLIAQPHAYAQDAITHAQVEFEEGVGPTYPVDPDDPDTESNGGGSEGSFLIVSVSDFYFGSMNISPHTQLLGIRTLRPNIQVVDLRGTNAGWRVSVSVSRFENEAGELSLPGAAIYIANGRPNSTSISDEPVQIRNVKLTTDAEITKLITAAPGAGAGLWVMRWYPVSDRHPAFVQLEVPSGSATIGSHTAEIAWILENGPVA